jgi:hypothetical protein
VTSWGWLLHDGDFCATPVPRAARPSDRALLHLARLDDVVVVEHQHDVARDGVQVVEEGLERRVDRRPGRLHEAERISAHSRHRGSQGGEEVGREHHRVVVALVEREPRHGPSLGGSCGQPLP